MAEYGADSSPPSSPDPGLSPTLVATDLGKGQVGIDSNQPLPTIPATDPAPQATPATPASPAAVEPVAPAPVVPPAEPVANPELDAATEVVADAGMDINKFRDEFIANGELSEESFTALAANGLPKELVQEFIAGQQARQQLLEYNDKQIVGGPEKYASMVNWAAKALTEAEIAAFNTAIFTPDAEQRKLAIQGLHARYEATLGQEPQLLTGNQTGQGSGGFRSQAEITRAMSDPRYENDEAYRNDVIRKLALDL